jgi:hypothetical protein
MSSESQLQLPILMNFIFETLLNIIVLVVRMTVLQQDAKDNEK